MTDEEIWKLWLMYFVTWATCGSGEMDVDERRGSAQHGRDIGDITRLNNL